VVDMVTEEEKVMEAVMAVATVVMVTDLDRLTSKHFDIFTYFKLFTNTRSSGFVWEYECECEKPVLRGVVG